MKKLIFAFCLLTSFGVQAAELPACSSGQLSEQVKVAAQNKYNEQNQNRLLSPSEKRQQKINLQNLGAFAATDLAAFSRTENVAVANRLLEVKLNLRLKPEDMALCKSVAAYKDKHVYLLIYQNAEKIEVEILNFVSPRHADKLSFDYKTEQNTK